MRTSLHSLRDWRSHFRAVITAATFDASPAQTADFSTQRTPPTAIPTSFVCSPTLDFALIFLAVIFAPTRFSYQCNMDADLPRQHFSLFSKPCLAVLKSALLDFYSSGLRQFLPSISESASLSLFSLVFSWEDLALPIRLNEGQDWLC